MSTAIRIETPPTELCQWKEDISKFGTNDEKISPSGRYYFLLIHEQFIVIDTVRGTKLFFEYTNTVCEWALSKDLIFIKSSDNQAYFIQEVLKFESKNVRSVVIWHATFDYSAGTVKLSETFAPLHRDTNYSYDYQCACHLNDTLVVVLGRTSGFDTGLRKSDTQCHTFKYSELNGWTDLGCVELKRNGKSTDHEYLYPTLRDNQLYVFLSLKQNALIDIVSSWSDLFQVNIKTGNHNVIKTKNLLGDIQTDEELYAMNGYGYLTSNHRWNGDFLFALWTFNNNGGLTNYESYAAYFNLNTLLWQHIYIEGLLPKNHYIPLRTNLTDDNILIFSDFNKSKTQNLVHTYYLSIPVGTPKTLLRLMRLKTMDIYPKLKSGNVSSIWNNLLGF